MKAGAAADLAVLLLLLLVLLLLPLVLILWLVQPHALLQRLLELHRTAHFIAQQRLSRRRQICFTKCNTR